MKILQTIAEKKLADISLKKSDQAFILAVKTAVTVREESVVIDPNLLFQRLVKVAETSESLADYFRYELTNIPTSLFDNSGLMRPAVKSTLAQHIGSLVKDLPVHLPLLCH
ncbi:hypothetical protein BaRGS_00039998 [Batillaria attramentaria]|uniref:Uncharacterized protein n=1 Tax=Batillaria attramentaria TaxID=370345 RepID=A0ABD0J277_9CAEN